MIAENKIEARGGLNIQLDEDGTLRLSPRTESVLEAVAEGLRNAIDEVTPPESK